MQKAAPNRPSARRRLLRWIAIVTALLGLLGAVAVAISAPLPDRTFAMISGTTQSLISIGVPLLGVLLVAELRRPVQLAALLPTAGRALRTAALLAAIGIAISVAVTLLAGSDAVGGRWRNAGMVVLGSLLVQGVAQLIGLGMGLLIRNRVVAGLATVVLPLGLWALLGAVPVLRPAQSWLTPFPSAQHLLSGVMTPTAWAQWLTMLVIWGIGLPALGLRVDHRHHGGQLPSLR